MEIVTGDRYLEYLVKFVDRNAGTLLEGTLILKLNPVGLHYVQSRLEALQELEGLLAAAPVDYLRAYVSDLGDHRALEHLRRILGLLTSLKVISVLPPRSRDPTPLSLQAFGGLRVLELRGCDLSTSSPRGLLELRHTLEKLICHNSTDALRHVFASRIADIKDSPEWTRLTFVSCAQNRLVLMDESLQLLPSVETLDLSRNQFAKVDNLHRSPKLLHLDLGFNHLRSIACLSEVSCPIVKLVLRNNALTTLRGIEHLKSVEGLDLSYNLISSFSEMEILANLPRLQSLWLEGNPICYARWYRAYVYSFFFYPERLILDDCNISTKEYWERHIIYTSRQKQPPAYGFYFPAKDPVEEDCSALASKKKYSRLASIEDEEQRRHLCMEAIEKDTLSCDTDMFRKDEITTPDHDPKVIGLMNKVEHMKKERSVLWLRDLKDWMDQSPENLIDRNQQIDFNLDDGSDQSLEPLIDAKHFRESSHSVEGMKHGEGGGSISNLITSESPGNSNLDRASRTAIEPSVANDEKYFVAGLKSHKVFSEQDQMKDDSMNLENLSPLILNGNSGISSSAAGGRVYSELSINSARLTAIDEIIGSHSSSTFPGSPPHYQEDILHRRLYLEEEFLHLSSTSRFVDLPDSDTSYSDDESCGFSMSMSENDSTCIQDSTIDSSNHVGDNANNDLGNEHEKSYFTENNIPVCEHHAKLSSNKELSSNNHVDAAISCTSPCLNEDAGGTETINCKQQLRRGFVSFFGNLLPCNSLQECKKVNRALDSRKIDMKDVQGQSRCSAYCFSSGRMNGEVLGLKNGAEAVCTFRYDSQEQNEYLKDFFNSNIADSKTSETCQQIVFCGCIYEHASVSFESEVALLRSCKNKLYLLLIDESDGLGTVSRVLGCYGLDEIREIVTGLGLQALRVNMEKDVTYLFLPRTIDICEDLFSLLEVYGLSSSTIKCSLKSWEQVQVDLLEKYISGGLNTGIYFYSMILFWPDKCEENSWLSRSMFVIEGYIVVCTENFKQFGLRVDCHGKPPYYTFDLLCPIQNILEMVIEPEENGRCLTLIAANVQRENIFIADKKSSVRQESRRSCKWKFKWFSEDYLSKFVCLLKAMRSGASASPLHVKCPS